MELGEKSVPNKRSSMSKHTEAGKYITVCKTGNASLIVGTSDMGQQLQNISMDSGVR